MKISVIIPVLHEQDQINGIIRHLRSIDPDVEIIVVDGDPGGSTIAVIADGTVFRLGSSIKGRGNQLAAGTATASGDILLMLHADTFLPSHAFSSILTAVSRGTDWGAFRLGIDATSPLYRVIERFVDLRCKLFALPYGDQAIFVRRVALQEIGGIPAIPLMEDVALARKLRQTGFRFAMLSERVSTSPRRWQKDGVIRRTLHNWLLLLRYLCGTEPEELTKWYRPN
ncbi:TIGR04283 family arsenosugar biosynthesis glycosyltransferase [Trichlorobacter lovleyi]|uniref:Glycosyl transferase family 2 n=1 Tax=Trichlorobacter lovleyi (strain ATCC BAA-1151 / DSM 17278 / SZ) TaxID=398767 RepID=B3E2P9_TRIL1|nr:TIGR04283 family arsenosugar biosynthesis glycosyltransferase [Trichlorobacter lovleyi]ACD95706.1 glycosyl transferase family 2 [Trichlorobacter lovleyi SZ]